MSNRSIIYVDGFNLYYGALYKTQHKWLNLQALFEKLRQDDDIRHIKYFTTRVTGHKQANQLLYWRALQTCPKIEIIQGKFKKKNIRCQVPRCVHGGCRWFDVEEEKRTDVNIALSMFQDATDNATDRLILVSGDSDLIPPIAAIKTRFPAKRVTVYVPANSPVRGAATEIRGVAHKSATLPQKLIELCQFDDVLDDGMGGKIVKPTTW